MYDLQKIYLDIRPEIEQRYETFKTIWELGDNEIFPELIFCFCTPQTNAKYGWNAVKSLLQLGYLKTPILDEEKTLNEISEILSQSGVRFKKNKSKYIVNAIKNFNSGNGFKNFINNLISNNNIIETRNWLAENMYGIGMKEASHFLRNIGLGDEISILDRHILRCLVEYKVINKTPKSMSKKAYLNIEQQMKEFSKQINISMFELDFVFWYKAKNELFK
ncbi:MAG: N-glycosylase/DNA lyase [bacterium]